MIVQALHKIQHEYGYLPRPELLALAKRTNTPLYRIQEVASFFPHFRLTQPAALEVKVCRDMTCHLYGAGLILRDLEKLAAEYAPKTPDGPRRINITGTSCLGRCDRAPAVTINDKVYANQNEGELRALISVAMAGQTPTPDFDGARPPTPPFPWRADVYGGNPDYAALRQFTENPDREKLLKELETADLRGMGGAGVYAHRKWGDVWRARGEEKYVVVNGDESEPATFKDRELLLRTPWLVLEGALLAGYVVGATRVYVYIRHEYHEQIEAMRGEIRRAETLGACGADVFGTGTALPAEVFVSPGGYICGEQSALIEAMEDHRAEPRNKPPQLETNGLYDKPTLVSNVETFAWAPSIALKGGAWYRDQGAPGFKGLRFFSISGDVNRPGAYEVPNGITLRELIDRHCLGMTGRRTMRAFAPSGPSGGFLPAQIPIDTLTKGFEAKIPEALRAKLVPPGAKHVELLDIPMDLQVYRDLGLMLGAGVVVYGPDVDVADQAVNGLEFYRNESCGKCVPCRLGSQKLVEIGTALLRGRMSREQFPDTAALVVELGRTMESTSICGLGAVAANPLTSAVRYFTPDLERYLRADKPLSELD